MERSSKQSSVNYFQYSCVQLDTIGLKYSENDQIFYPNTALNIKSKIIPKGEKVLAIYTEDSLTDEMVYLQKRNNYKGHPKIKNDNDIMYFAHK